MLNNIETFSFFSSEINPYQNIYLQEEIEHHPKYSTVHVMEELTERDVEFIVQEDIVKKQCKVLHIAQNKMTSACASILANAFNKNDNIMVIK